MLNWAKDAGEPAVRKPYPLLPIGLYAGLPTSPRREGVECTNPAFVLAISVKQPPLLIHAAGIYVRRIDPLLTASPTLSSHRPSIVVR